MIRKFLHTLFDNEINDPFSNVGPHHRCVCVRDYETSQYTGSGVHQHHLISLPTMGGAFHMSATHHLT
jgi:hypothetical protein